MDLSTFLGDESLGGGSWADEEVDFNSISVSVSTTTLPSLNLGRKPRDFQDDSIKSDKNKFSNEKNFKVKVENLPYEINEESLVKFFETEINNTDIIEEVYFSNKVDPRNSKKNAYITFKKKDDYEEALKLNMCLFFNRKIFIKPVFGMRQEGFDSDWKNSGRKFPSVKEGGKFGWGNNRNISSPFKDRKKKDNVELDWSLVRNTTQSTPQRFRSRNNFEKKNDLSVDWHNVRNNEDTGLSSQNTWHEKKYKKPECELDWKSVRFSDPPSNVLPKKNRYSWKNKKIDKDPSFESPRSNDGPILKNDLNDSITTDISNDKNPSIETTKIMSCQENLCLDTTEKNLSKNISDE